MSDSRHQLETRLIHAGEPSPRISGAVVMPLYQSSTYLTEGETSYHDLRYIRLNNTPNHRVLHAKLAALEGAEAALVAASGMAAITTSLLSVLSAGDHLLVQNCVYGGVHNFITSDLPAWGIQTTFIDADDPDSWEEHLRKNTRAIYVETIANPLLQIPDLTAAVRFAKAHQLLSLIDNTFATPVNFRPIEHGFDFVLHSCSKYLNGHNDIVGGAVIGRKELVEQVLHKLNHLGGTMDPHACFLLHRGIKTLALRVRYQNESAHRLARFLEGHPAVARVHYPGLESHPQHDRACSLFDGYGGMVSFELAGGVHAAQALIEGLSLPLHAPSLGGLETLIIQPATSSHRGMSPEDRRRAGISDSLVRLSVGVEATEDLIADFENALRP